MRYLLQNKSIFCRLIAEQFEAALTDRCDGDLKPMLGKIFHLHLLSTMEANLSQMLVLGLLKPEQVGGNNIGSFGAEKLYNPFSGFPLKHFCVLLKSFCQLFSDLFFREMDNLNFDSS